MKRFLLVLTVLLAVLIGLGLWLGRNSDMQLALFEMLIEKSTGLTLILEDPKMDLGNGSFSASRLALVPPENPAQPHINAQDLGIAINRTGNTGAGFLQASVSATAITVFASNKGDSVNPSPKQWVNYLRYLPDQLRIDVFHIISAQDVTQVISATDIKGQRESTQQYDLTLNYLHQGEVLQVYASVSDTSRSNQQSALLGSASISAEDFTQIELSGSVRGDAREFNYQLSMSAYIPDLSNYRDLIAGQSGTVLGGGLTAAGLLEGNNTALTISDARFSLQNLPSYAFQASGEIHYAFDGSNSLALTASGQLGDPELLRNWIDIDLKELGEARATLDLGGSLQALRAERFTLSTFADNGLQLSLTGEALPDVTPASDNSITGLNRHRASFSASGPTLALLQPWVGKLPVELGAWQIKSTLQQTAAGIALSEMQLSAGDNNTVRISGANGSALITPATDNSETRIKDALLPLKARIANIAALTELLGIDPGANYHGIGPVVIDAVLEQGAAQWSLNKVSADIKQPYLVANASGAIQSLTDTPQAKFALSLTRLSPQLLGERLPEQLLRATEGAAITGSAELKATQDSASLSAINLRASGFANTQISINGALNDLYRPAGQVALQFNSDNQALLQQLSGRAIARSKGRLDARISDKGIRLDGGVDFNKSHFQLGGELRSKNDRLSSIALSIDSKALWLADLGIAAQTSEASDQDEPGSPLSLSRYLDKAPALPFDLQINLGRVYGASSKLDGLRLHLDASDRRYLLRDFTVQYGEAIGEMRGIIDHNGSTPFVSLAVDARQIALGKLLTDLGMAAPIDGALSLRGGLSALGDTPASLLNALDGSLSIALEKALIQGAAYDMLATDILAWLYTGASQQASTFVDCAMAQIALAKGVAHTDTLFVESPNMIATGKGSINFHNDGIDFRVTPYSKSRRLQVPATVKIKGTLQNPEVKPSVAKAAADATAEALSLLPKLLLKAFGADKYQVKARPCEPRQTPSQSRH